MKTIVLFLVLFFTCLLTLSHAQEGVQGLIPIKEVIPEEIRNEYRTNNTENLIRARIAYGLRAFSGQFPYMALLHLLVGNSIIMCSATLIAPTFVVTTAVCLDREFRAIDAWLGSIDNKAFPAPTSAIGYANYPLYKSPGSQYLEHNLALIRLASSVTYTPAYLPTRASTSINYDGINMVTSGWGMTELGVLSQFQLFTYVTGTPISACGSIRSDKVICAKGEGNSKTAAGDLGGPLLSGNTVIGVVSFNYGDHNGYTRIDRYLDWISSYTGQRIQ